MAKRELSESAMNAVFDSFVGSPLSIVADRCGCTIARRVIFSGTLYIVLPLSYNALILDVLHQPRCFVKACPGSRIVGGVGCVIFLTVYLVEAPVPE